MIQINLGTKQRLTDSENTGTGELGSLGWMYTLLYWKQTTKGLLSGTGSSAQCCAEPGCEGVWGRMDTCVCTAESLCCPPKTTITLLIGCTPIENKNFKKQSD